VSDCAELRTSLGVYVLGAIDPAERSRLETHLEHCPSCRDELAGLAGMPALLGRVSEAQLSQVAGPPPELLETLLARAVERRGLRSRLRSLRFGPRGTPVVLAACALLLVGGLVGGLVAAQLDDGRGTATPPSPSASPSSGAGGERLTASDPGTKIRAELVLQRKSWGTKLELHLAGVPKGGTCQWFAVSRDGRRDMLGSWSVPYDRGYGVYESSTMFKRDQITSFQVVTLDGRPLISIPG
jgi:hypothetical protein